MGLSSWANFYVILGSCAGALTGLQFVVMTLINDNRSTGSSREVRAFGTPTVVHFCAALVIAAAMTVPWSSPGEIRVFLSICGAAGVVYTIETIWHARKTSYRPVFEDWVWHAVFPLTSYAVLGASAMLLGSWGTRPLLLAIAAATLTFLLIGIHNAWDTVTYLAQKRGQAAPSDNTSSS